MQARLYHHPREEQLTESGLFVPDQQTTDKLWYLIIGAFVIVLFVAALALITSAFRDGKTDLLVTVFTSAATFLAGLVAPSPITRRRRGDE